MYIYIYIYKVYCQSLSLTCLANNLLTEFLREVVEVISSQSVNSVIFNQFASQSEHMPNFFSLNAHYLLTTTNILKDKIGSYS